MGEKKELVCRYMAQGMKRDKALSICGISKHQYYYRSTGGKRGRRPSRFTLQLIGDQIIKKSNEEVTTYMKELFSNPLVDYGYHRMTGQLALAGFYINHKKVYRLMKEAGLLQAKPKGVAKNYVKYRIICPVEPLRLMEMDIKMIWIEGLRRYAYVLTIIDVFTRAVLHWQAGFEMKHNRVQKAWREVIENYLQAEGVLSWETHIEIRSDNGPQFCAKKLRKFFKDNYLAQTFTHPYTPQENGHVESFHAIISKAIRGQYFENLPELYRYLKIFYDFYNYDRIHGSTVKLPPMTFWQQWKLGNIDRKVIDEKRRKVRFALKIPPQEVRKVNSAGHQGQQLQEGIACSEGGPADYGSQREVLSLNLEGLDAPSNSTHSTQEQLSVSQT